MRRAWSMVIAGTALLVSCKHEPTAAELCDHLGKLDTTPPTEVQVEHCLTEMANAKSTSQKEYACFAPCAVKAPSQADVDTCKFTCTGEKESPATVCRRLAILRGGGGRMSTEGTCVARYSTMQTAAPAQFDCAAACVRKSTSRADSEGCL